jgi:hypothetical protein
VGGGVGIGVGGGGGGTLQFALDPGSFVYLVLRIYQSRKVNKTEDTIRKNILLPCAIYSQLVPW